MSLVIKHLSCVYGANTPQMTAALRDVSLTVEAGEFVGLMGRTGCGKTTLLLAAAGLLPPTEGEVLLDGEDIYARGYPRDTLHRKLGVVFQRPEQQLFASTVEKDVGFALRGAPLSEAEKKERVFLALEQVGLDARKVAPLSPLELSGGEKRRAAIAGVLVSQPELLLLDEPIAGLDPQGKRALLDLLRRLHGEGVTILLISHNADAVADCCGRVLVLDRGEVAADGPTEQVFSRGEDMARWGVCSGQAARAAALLRSRGVPIPPEVIRYRELLPYLADVGRRRFS